MKYIDAEKLTKAIEDKGLDCSFALKMERLDILALIDSLQQEQPEVDLEKAYKSYMESRKDDLSGNAVTVNMKDLARHFYELGQSTKYQQDREEFAKLKAKEWINGYDEGYAKGLNARKED